MAENPQKLGNFWQNPHLVYHHNAELRLNPKKTYCVDTGLEWAVSSRRIPNDGARFENMVYLALRRRTRDICYFGGDDGECDFVVRERHAVTAAVQACARLTDECRDREIEGLSAAMESCGLDSGTIVTMDQRDTLECGGRRIEVVPFWEWSCAVDGRQSTGGRETVR